MNRPVTVLAFDFGASNGRAIKAVLQTDGQGNHTLALQEIHRFENTPYTVSGHLCWNFSALMEEVRHAIALAGDFDSVGFDTWGVDFGLLDEHGQLLGDPVHYRDVRTDSYPEDAFSVMNADELYQRTGNQLMGINTLFQLLALKRQQPDVFAQAKTLLFMPDLFAYHVGAQPVCETTIASTSQMLDPSCAKWSEEVLDAFGIPGDLLPTLVASGTITGQLTNGAKIIAVAGHDTQCAVAAMPAENGDDAAFLSCGTWSLLGTELDAPILSPESRVLELSNEWGANGKVNYLKNIIGLWLIQESRREWKRQGQVYSYAELEALAREAVPLRSLIDPNAPQFAKPGDIPGRVKDYCCATGQYIPESVGDVMRCLYDSLALTYRAAIEQLQTITGKTFTSLHILGGGVKDRFLCQLSADATGQPVVAGPAEATALGNILIQLTALGALPSLEAGRMLIAQTEPLKPYIPVDGKQWQEAYTQYQIIQHKGAL